MRLTLLHYIIASLRYLGSDSETRRRSAADFVRALCTYFEAQLVEIFGGHVSNLLSDYATDRVRNWAQKDVVFCLVGALATRGETAQHGATKVSQLVIVICDTD